MLSPKPRILIIDDNPAIHEDFNKILCPPDDLSDFERTEAEVFGEAPPIVREVFEVDHSFQGLEGLEKIVQSVEEGRPRTISGPWQNVLLAAASAADERAEAGSDSTLRGAA